MRAPPPQPSSCCSRTAACHAHARKHAARALPLQTGEVCLDILQSAWSPAWTLHSVCQAILALLSAPAADSPLNCDAGGAAHSMARTAVRGTQVCVGSELCSWQLASRPSGWLREPMLLHCLCSRYHATTLVCAGNLLRAGDVRGYNSLARMYTIEHAMG